MRKKQRTLSEMRQMVVRYESSNQSRKSFCLSEGINEHTFQYWRDKVNQKGKFAVARHSSPFEQISPNPSSSAPTHQGHIRLHTPSGHYLELPLHYPVADLQILLSSLSC